MADIQINRNQEFVRLWTQHTRRIFAYLLTLVPNRADADDLLQETGAALWEKFDQYQSDTNFFAWSCRTAYFCASNFRRKQAKSAVTLDEDLLETLGAELVAASADLDTELDALVSCLGKLRSQDRELIGLRYRAGASVRAVADELGRSADALYKSLQRIHESLLECVRRRLTEEAAE